MTRLVFALPIDCKELYQSIEHRLMSVFRTSPSTHHTLFLGLGYLSLARTCFQSMTIGGTDEIGAAVNGLLDPLQTDIGEKGVLIDDATWPMFQVMKAAYLMKACQHNNTRLTFGSALMNSSLSAILSGYQESDHETILGMYQTALDKVRKVIEQSKDMKFANSDAPIDL